MLQFEDAPGYAAFRFRDLPAEAGARLERGAASPELERPVGGSAAHEAMLVEAALAELKRQGVSFGDLRLGRDHSRQVLMQDENLATHNVFVSAGIGIRALVHGFWGFSASSELTPEGVRRAAAEAAAMARAVAAVTPRELGIEAHGLAAEPAHVARFDTPVGICPFEAPVNAIAEPFRAAAALGLAVPGIKKVQAFAMIFGRRRVFASTEGAHITTTHCVMDTLQRYVAVAKGTSAYRTILGTAMAGGLEHLAEADFPGQAADACRDALAKCAAPKPEPGRYDLILDGHNLALTMHETVGHPTELDRVAGYELGFAGGSFASLDKLGTFRYGSPLVNFTANNRLRYGAASQGYDDEGVECQAFPVIREGILVGYGSNRETARLIGQQRANGTCRATGWADPPIVRIPNLFLEPGPERLSLDDLVRDTESGILMLGRDSFSIDQMRYNFQFGADMSYRIRDGKVAEPLRDVIYQSISPEFWGACDAICDASEWRMHGVFNCGKGQPTQLSKMMHGAAPARFRQIRVGY